MAISAIDMPVECSVDLHHGDCLEVMKDIPDGSVDLILADPPYGTTACKWDSIIPLEPMWEQLKRIIKPNGAIVMTASQPFTTTLIASNMKMFKYCWVWEKARKTGNLNAKKMPMKAHEDVCVFYRQQPEYRSYTDVKNPLSGSKATPTSTQNYRKVDGQSSYKRPPLKTKSSVITGYPVEERGIHPTQKPVALMEYMIKTYTLEGETVLDFTMGSGTTGVACKNTGRNFIGIEMDQGYFDIASKRIREAS